MHANLEEHNIQEHNVNVWAYVNYIVYILEKYKSDKNAMLKIMSWRNT